MGRDILALLLLGVNFIGSILFLIGGSAALGVICYSQFLSGKGNCPSNFRLLVIMPLIVTLFLLILLALSRRWRRGINLYWLVSLLNLFVMVGVYIYGGVILR